MPAVAVAPPLLPITNPRSTAAAPTRQARDAVQEEGQRVGRWGSSRHTPLPP